MSVSPRCKFPGERSILESSYSQSMAGTWSHTLEASLWPSFGCTPPGSRAEPKEHAQLEFMPFPSSPYHKFPGPRDFPGPVQVSVPGPSMKGWTTLPVCQILTKEGRGVHPHVWDPSQDRTEMGWKRRGQQVRPGTGSLQLTFLCCPVQPGMLQNPRILNWKLSFHIVMKIVYLLKVGRQNTFY